MSPGTKKRSSPSTLRRNARRKEEFLKKKHNPAIVNPGEEKEVDFQSPTCNQCDYKAASEKGLRQHTRMKHKEAQLDSEVPSSSFSTLETLREPLANSDSIIVSRSADSRDEKPFKCEAPVVDGCEKSFNCEEDLKNHILYDHSSVICYNCEGEFWDQQPPACPFCSVVWPCFAPAM